MGKEAGVFRLGFLGFFVNVNLVLKFRTFGIVSLYRLRFVEMGLAKEKALAEKIVTFFSFSPETGLILFTKHESMRLFMFRKNPT